MIDGHFLMGLGQTNPERPHVGTVWFIDMEPAPFWQWQIFPVLKTGTGSHSWTKKLQVQLIVLFINITGVSASTTANQSPVY